MDSESGEHIATRSERYPDAVDIAVAWTGEAAADPHAMISDPDPRSRTGAIRVVGYSPAAGFVHAGLGHRSTDSNVQHCGMRPTVAAATRRQSRTRCPVSAATFTQWQAVVDEHSRRAGRR